MYRLIAVLEIIASISADLTLDEILYLITEKTTRFLTVDGCAISLWNREQNALVVKADYTAPGAAVEKDDIYDIGQAYYLQDYPATAKVLLNHIPTVVYVDDPLADEQERALLKHYHWQGVLMLPMVYKTETIGLMEIYTDRTDPAEFSLNMIKLCQILANQAAVAIQNGQFVTELDTKQKALRRLSRQLVNAQEEERRRIARELHDELGQHLIALKINLDIANQTVPKQASPKHKRSIQEAGILTTQTQDMARNLWLKLRPAMLDDLGLISTLYWEFDRHEQQTGLKINFEVHPLDFIVGPDLEINIYRIVMEALTNVARHAQANQVWIKLQIIENNIVVCIKDDGIGFNIDEWPGSPNKQPSLGLVSIRERVDLFDGEFQIHSEFDGGTEICVYIPVASGIERFAGDGHQ